MIPPTLRNINTVIPPLILFSLITFNILPFSLSNPNPNPNPNPSEQLNPKPIIMPGKRNLSTPFSLSSQNSPRPTMARNKKLRRLPHVFSKVLELPFDSDANVAIEDRPECIRFVVKEEEAGDRVVLSSDVRAHVIEVHPGVTKVVIRRRESRFRVSSIDDLELNVWRFRLPATARAELAMAVYANGELVVTVPKNGWGENNSRVGDCKGGFKGNMGSLVLVQ